MITRPEWYAFLIVELVAVLWLARKLDRILEELKALREKYTRSQKLFARGYLSA